MNNSPTYKQPWFHSPWLDSISMYGFPLLATFILFFFTDLLTPKLITQFALFIGVIDFGHIFAQWFRVKYNPTEKSSALYKYLIFFVISLFIVAFITSLSYLKQMQSFLVYLVLYHFIKQQYGIIKIYSKTDGVKSKLQNRVTDAFVYLSMAYPVIHWHSSDLLKTFYWKELFIDIPYINSIEVVLRVFFIATFVGYVFYEYKITKRNKGFNIPKNLSVLGALIGWNFALIFPTYQKALLFTIVYTHNIAYIVLIWVVGRRDRKLQGYQEPEGLKKIFCWTSVPGFFTYYLMINLMASSIITLWYWVAHNKVINEFLLYHVITQLPQVHDRESFIWHLVNALFYTTQGTHYIIDGFLWKKEKDYAWHLRQEQLKAQPQT